MHQFSEHRGQQQFYKEPSKLLTKTALHEFQG